MDVTFFDRVDIGVWCLTIAAVCGLAALVVPFGRLMLRSLARLFGLAGAAIWVVHAFAANGVGV